MINSNTVFVLGAGASMPYGFPSGFQLRSRLCAAKEGKSSELANILAEHTGIFYKDIVHFAQTFRDSNIASIDAFLSRRDEFVEIGKLAIAATLCACEKPDIIASELDDDWYFALWNAMVAEVHAPEDILKNKIKIVSFNYDRSLEYFLYSSIKNTFALSDADAKNILSQLPIKHVYGQLGEFGSSTNHLPYIEEINGPKLRIAASGIRIIPETREQDEVFMIARHWFYESLNICFLGFGFDQLNIARLELRDMLEQKQQASGISLPSVFTSGYQKTRAEFDMARERLVGKTPTNWISIEEKNLNTLRNTRLLV